TARHLLLLLIPGTSCIGLGLLTIGNRISHFKNPYSEVSPVACDRKGRQNPVAGDGANKFAARIVTPIMMAVVLAVLLLGLATPHRTNRSTYRDAGYWLARQTSDTDGTVFDTRGWTSLFSKMPTYQADRAKDALADPRLEYVVVLEEELLGRSERSRTLQVILDRTAKPVARFTSPDARDATETLVVYRCLKKELPKNRLAVEWNSTLLDGANAPGNFLRNRKLLKNVEFHSTAKH
ncbi:MAG: hypothetical protein PVH19_05595, partial [Planctomycetia bacterium]